MSLNIRLDIFNIYGGINGGGLLKPEKFQFAAFSKAEGFCSNSTTV
jgi:hypothetical protein